MKTSRLVSSKVVLALIVGLSACGGGGGSGTPSSGNTTDGTGAAITRGVITGFGSVFVNGIEYEIEGDTEVTLDGEAGAESGLEVGMVVTLQGTVNADGTTGTATSIVYADELEGVVTATALTGGIGTLTVMGQTVNVSAETVFESDVGAITTLDGIAVGNVVEVSGHASSSGTIYATRVEVKRAAQDGSEIEVKGVISGLTATTFQLGGLTVDFSALSADALPAVALADGLFVEVKSTTAFDGSGALIASEIELEDDGFRSHEGEEGEDVEIDGMVTADFAGNQFEINGRIVLIDDGTEFENGDSSSLVAGTKAKVEAQYDDAGQLVASEIEFAEQAELGLEGTVEAVDTAASTLTVLGQTIVVNSSTIMIDESADAERYFNLADISAANSDYVEIEGYLDAASGNLVATKLKRDSASSDAAVNGIATVDGATLTVAGVTIDLSGISTPPAIASGDVVEVEGVYSEGVLFADVVSVDDDGSDESDDE